MLSFFNLFHADSTSGNGGIIDRRLNEVPIVIECMIAAGVASGNKVILVTHNFKIEDRRRRVATLLAVNRI